MLNRLYNLVMLQIGDKFTKKSDKNILPYLFKALGFIAVGVLSYLAFLLLDRIIQIKPTNAVVLFIILLSQLITLVGNSVSLTTSLYDSKDNPILLSLPTRHAETFASKLIVFYILELYSNVTFLLPILIGVGIYMKQHLAFYLLSLLSAFVLPIISVLIGAIISIPLSLLRKLFKRASYVYILMFVGLLVLLFIVSHNILVKLPQPIRFIALYNEIIKAIVGFIDNVNKYALFYKWFGNIVFGINLLKNMGLVLALIVGLCIVTAVFAWPLFFKLASNSSENAVMKKHAGTNKVSKNTFLAFLKKEVLISIRSIGNIVNNYSMIVFMPLVIYILNALLKSLDISFLGEKIITGFNVLVGSLMMISANSGCAKALSEEGSEFTLLKTSPVDTKLIAWAKVTTNSILSIVLLVISILVLNGMGIFESKELLFILFSLILIDVGHILWSFKLDLLNPQIKDMALFGNISNQTNVNKSMFIGILFSVIFGLLAILLVYLELSFIYFLLLFIFVGWRFVVFDASLKSYFYDIEL